MFDDRVGAALRAMRIRRGLRQADIATLASVSTMTVSRIERGHLETLSLQVIRRVARVLEVRMDLSPWSRHGDIHRFANAAHAGLVESFVRNLVALGWEARAEVSFSRAGERGFIDVLARHEATRTLLVVEVKTEIVDVGELLGTLDRKRRLAPVIARELGWPTDSVACGLIVRDSSMNRRRVAEHSSTIRTLLPDDGRRLRSSLRHPEGIRSGVAFWSTEHPRLRSQRGAGTRRVRRPSACSPGAR